MAVCSPRPVPLTRLSSQLSYVSTDNGGSVMSASQSSSSFAPSASQASSSVASSLPLSTGPSQSMDVDEEEEVRRCWVCWEERRFRVLHVWTPAQFGKPELYLPGFHHVVLECSHCLQTFDEFRPSSAPQDEGDEEEDEEEDAEDSE